MNPARLIMAIGVLVAASACTGPDATPPAPVAPSAAYTGKWSKLDTPCPTLTTATAAALEISGPGTPGAANADTPIGQNIGCVWGTGEGSVSVVLQTTLSDGPLPADQATAQAFQKKFDEFTASGEILRSIPDPGFQDKAYLAIHKDRATLQLWVLSSNAAVTVYRQGPELGESAWDAALRENRAALQQVAEDVLDDLA